MNTKTEEQTTEIDAQSLAWIEKAKQVCTQAAQGDMEQRLLNIPVDHPTAGLLFAINDLIDVTDAFVREAQACLEYASQEKFYRKLYETGLFGSYLNAAHAINSATASMADKSDSLKEANKQRDHLVGELEESAIEMASTAEELLRVSENTSKRTKVMAGSSAETSDEITGVAKASGQCAEELEQVNCLVDESTEIVAEAVGEAKETAAVAKRLQESSSEISNVTQVIQDIAQHTSLLSLNAAVEAARAGEAGRGFAVVASEVKQLAEQTSSATKSIGLQIEELTTSSDDVSKAIAAIGERVTGIEGLSSQIRDAMTRQREETLDIRKGADQSAERNRGVTRQIEEVSKGAEEIHKAATDLEGQAQKLSNLAREISQS